MAGPTNGSADATRPAAENAGWFATAGLSAAVAVPVGALLTADSPRLAGTDDEHVRALIEADCPLPPIIVHAATMRVIDGAHRLRVAVLRGAETIEARLFDGGAEWAFVLAVQANLRHGLPLSLADREAAATRILGSHAYWSDRVIARVTGLAPRTVRNLRVAGGNSDPPVRVGRDGRVRPMNIAEGRLAASRILAGDPTASLRQVAKAAGISAATVRDVRDRMRSGESPVPPQVRRRRRRSGGPERDSAVILQGLMRDPSLRFTEDGRALLRWLHRCVGGLHDWESLVTVLPTHCAFAVADLARGCAREWLAVADQVGRAAERSDRSPA